MGPCYFVALIAENYWKEGAFGGLQGLGRAGSLGEIESPGEIGNHAPKPEGHTVQLGY